MKEESRPTNFKININMIIGCAFRICYIYLLKCFLPAITIGSYVIMCPKDYDNELMENILYMKRLMSNENNTTMIKPNEEKLSADDDIMSNKLVNFTETTDDIDEEKILYTLKIKQIGTSEPVLSDYAESDIYVNSKTKMFLVRSTDGFKSFPLIKQSIVNCERIE